MASGLEALERRAHHQKTAWLLPFPTRTAVSAARVCFLAACLDGGVAYEEEDI